MSEIVLGSYVNVPQYGYLGRVKDKYHWFGETPEDEEWLDMQRPPIVEDEVHGPWVSILVDGGGSVLFPLSRVEPTEPFELRNPFASFYFGEG